MKAIETELAGCFVLEPRVMGDERGYFFEAFNQAHFERVIGQAVHFVQDNQSFSTKGVLRGLHAQQGDYAQAKLVRVLKGEVLDVAVDARKGSATFGQYVAVRLSAENKKQLFVPRGFLHGFVVLSDTADFFYKCDNYYAKDQEWGVRYDDPTLGIDWQSSAAHLTISEKDSLLPDFNDAMDRFRLK